MSCAILTEALPRATAALAPAMQPRAEETVDRSLQAVQGAAVVSHSTRVEVSTPFPPHRVPEVREFPRMALSAEPALELHQGATHASRSSYCAVYPPSTIKCVPVMKEASSEARKRMA
jgi:hypothetical protein